MRILPALFAVKNHKGNCIITGKMELSPSCWHKPGTVCMIFRTCELRICLLCQVYQRNYACCHSIQIKHWFEANYCSWQRPFHLYLDHQNLKSINEIFGSLARWRSLSELPPGNPPLRHIAGLYSLLLSKDRERLASWFNKVVVVNTCWVKLRCHGFVCLFWLTHTIWHKLFRMTNKP